MTLRTSYIMAGIGPSKTEQVGGVYPLCLLLFQNNWFSGRDATEIVPSVTQRELGAKQVLWERERKERRKARQELGREVGDLLLSEITWVDICYMLIRQYCLLEVRLNQKFPVQLVIS